MKYYALLSLVRSPVTLSCCRLLKIRSALAARIAII